MSFYSTELASIHATAYGQFAKEAISSIIAHLQQVDNPIKRVVDVGCGDGYSTMALCQAGFQTTAIEQSGGFLRLARERTSAAYFIHGSCYDVDLPPCEAVIALGEVLTYHRPTVNVKTRLQTFFSKVHASLAPGGLLIFDVILAGTPSLSGKTWQEDRDWTLLVEVREDPPARSLQRHMVAFIQQDGLFSRTEEHHWVRLFDAWELRSWLRQAGFIVEIRDTYGPVRLLPRRAAIFAIRT